MTIAQFPNWQIITAALAFVVSRMSQGIIQSIATSIFFAAAIIWAYEEMYNGVNWFRRTLGSVVMLYLLYRLTTLL